MLEKWRSGVYGQAVNAAVVIAALCTVPVVVLQEQGQSGGWIEMADWGIWTIFVLEYLIEITLAPSRQEYARRNWLSLIVIFLSFPLVPALLSLTRLARLARVLRLLRLVGVTMRALHELRAILARRGVLYVMCLTVLMILAGGTGLTMLEPESVRGDIGDGIWWAVVTATTVGYGDIAPHTLWGRVIAVLIMMAGVGMVSTLAASITTYFVGKEEGGELADLRERLVRIEAVLQQVAIQQNQVAAPPLPGAAPQERHGDGKGPAGTPPDA